MQQLQSIQNIQDNKKSGIGRKLYEERMAILTVYCGVSEGIMADVNVVANNRAEFFLVGKPLKGERTACLNCVMWYVLCQFILSYPITISADAATAEQTTHPSCLRSSLPVSIRMEVTITSIKYHGHAPQASRTYCCTSMTATLPSVNLCQIVDYQVGTNNSVQ